MVPLSRKNHEMIDGKLLQTDKKYSHLKLRQKEKIAEWMYLETIVVYKNTQNVTCIIQVKHCSIRKSKVNLIFSIFEGSNPYPTRELKVELFNVNRGETFVVLTHNFLSEVTNEEITNLSFVKRKLLKKLGSIIEKSFKLESQSGNGIE